MSPSNNTHTDILIAGAVAAFSIDLLVYPLDTIKTRVQSPDYKRLYVNQATNGASRALFRGLYQGIGSVVLATVPSSGAFFTTYEATKSLLIRTNSSLPSAILPTPVINSLASITGELVSCLILTPAEVLKQNAQVLHNPSESTRAFDAAATRTALKKFNKPSQLWRGYTVLAARNLPFTAMQFPMFEHLKQKMLEYRKKKGVYSGTLLERGTVTAIAAGSAGSVAAVITTPIDVVKTRIMLSAGSDGEKAKNNVSMSGTTDLEKEHQATKKARKGGVAVGREILRTEGVKGLFRGAVLRGAWTTLGSGLYLGIYESGRSYLEMRRERGEPLL